MSRVAKNPIKIPKGVEVNLQGLDLTIKGQKGSLSHRVPDSVTVEQADGELRLSSANDRSWALAGTSRALINNMVIGVSEGFEKKLELVGVGYRAQAKGKVLNLSLGYSHPVDYSLPEGVTAETPSNTEIVLRSSDKQKLGQVAAEIRAVRPCEPYKGKGVRFAGERVSLKEGKKK